MKAFDDNSLDGNEKAIRKGNLVPNGDINLAWVKAPKLSPENNVIVLDTSNLTPYSETDLSSRPRIMYADHLGILHDEDGNSIIEDEFPSVTDEFSVEETYDISSENEFANAHVFPFRHISRYFHLDQDNLTHGESPEFVLRQNIIVEDSNGFEYLDGSGGKRYKVKLVKSDAYLNQTDEENPIGIYRLWVFVDVDNNESLYLRYNKIELNNTGTETLNPVQDYKEILNPQPYFSYRPEESDVADIANKELKIYSTKSTSKQHILKDPSVKDDGYKIYVPKKAIRDPRIFQLFRWRIVCEFEERYKIDPSTSNRVVNAGVITVNPTYPRPASDLEVSKKNGGVPYNYFNPPVKTPYVFYNLEKSEYNPTNVRIVNPISERAGNVIVEDLDPSIINPNVNSSTAWKPGFKVPLKSVSAENAKEYAAYWAVNLEKITDEELKKFDVLFLGAEVLNEKLYQYMPKLFRFTRDYGGSVYISGWGSSTRPILGPKITNQVNSLTGAFKNQALYKTSSIFNSSGLGDTIAPVDSSDELLKGQTPYGGWDFNYGDGALNSISPFKFHPNYLFPKDKSYAQFFYEILDNEVTSDGLNYWKTLFDIEQESYSYLTSATPSSTPNTGDRYPVTLIKRFASGGSFIYDLQDIVTQCGALEDTFNFGPRRAQIPNYFQQINSARFEGSYKFAWNWILSTVKSRSLDSSDEKKYSSKWKFESPWNASWVINGNVLKDVEKEKYNFAFEPQDKNTQNLYAWRRKLSSKNLKNLIDEGISQTFENYRDIIVNIANSTRKYSIEVTNESVSVPTTLSDDDFPHAWTEKYSPEFIIPDNFGPHIVDDDFTIGKYADGKYSSTVYNNYNYAVKVNATYNTTEQSMKEYVTEVTAKYKAQEVLPSGKIYLHKARPLAWSENGSNQILFNRFGKDWGAPRPNSILSKNELLFNKSNTYPYTGINEAYSMDSNSSGEVVRFIQYALNKLHYIITEQLSKGLNGPIPEGLSGQAGVIEGYYRSLKYRRPGKELVINGTYDQQTANAVKELKRIAGARRVDGIADSEFFAILGSQIQYWGLSYSGFEQDKFEYDDKTYLKYTAMVNDYMKLANMSDAISNTKYIEVSDNRKKVDRITNVYVIQYPKVFAFSHVSIIPSLLNSGSSISVDFVDVAMTRVDTTRFTGDMLNKVYQYGDPPEDVRINRSTKRIYWKQGDSDDGSRPNSSNYVSVIQDAVLANVDGYYGAETSQKVYNWKTSRAYLYGIEINNDWGWISEVTEIQKLLGITSDGYYGQETRDAVRNWQSRFGGKIPVDGIWGPITQKYTDEFFNFLDQNLQTRSRIPRLPEAGRPYPDELLVNYDGSNALVKNINKKVKHNEEYKVPLPGTQDSIGNTIIIGVSQSVSEGGKYGDTKCIGIKELCGIGADFIGFTTLDGSPAKIDYEGVFKATKKISTNKEVIFTANTDDYTGEGYLTNVRWGLDYVPPKTPDLFPGFDPSTIGLYRINSSNVNVDAVINEDGKITLRHQDVVNDEENYYTDSGWIPKPPEISISGVSSYLSNRTYNPIQIFDYKNNPVYAMDEAGRLFPGHETGSISKPDGVKILCNKDKKPIGIPALPKGTGTQEFQRHFLELSIDRGNTNQLVKIGFYDFKAKEFIINKNKFGRDTSSMTYYEYMQRGGASNVYIAVVVDAGQTTISNNDYPHVSDDDATIPFKCAKPVYGVSYRKQSKIGIDKLSPTLGQADPWPIPIRVGSFNRVFTIPNKTDLTISGWVGQWKGKTVKAHYSVPESNSVQWSRIFGRPAIDIVAEQPILLDKNTIQLKRAPILVIKEPTNDKKLADPMRPVIQIYIKEDINSTWTKLNRTNIKDYNSSNGIIYLEDNILPLDSNLIKVDYTTLSNTYEIKRSQGNIVNLNPRINKDPSIKENPIYVYLLPEFVKNEDNEIIEESQNSSTLYVSTDSSIFNMYSQKYNPLAIQIGIIYVSTAFDIGDLKILDTRRRGGGISHDVTDDTIYTLDPDAKSYWDFGNGSGKVYQGGGYVIIRLPKMLKAVFTRDEITKIIERNIPIGVEYKIEDTEGRDWDG